MVWPVTINHSAPCVHWFKNDAQILTYFFVGTGSSTFYFPLIATHSTLQRKELLKRFFCLKYERLTNNTTHSSIMKLIIENYIPLTCQHTNWKPHTQGLVKGAILLFQKSLLLFLTWREYFYSQPTHFSFYKTLNQP